MTSTEHVVLVDAEDRELGTMEKYEAHRQGQLHRAFSIFLFNDNDELLIHQRAEVKYHSAGLWTNTCCSHPRPGESLMQAAERRLQEEMGVQSPLKHLFSFLYKADLGDGMIEHELDHVYIGRFNGTPQPDPAEVSHWRFMPLDQLILLMDEQPHLFTVWFKIALPRLLRERVMN